MPAVVRKPPLVFALASFVLIIACLYWGGVVLIPVALAMLPSCLLNPVVSMLQHPGLGRIPWVILTVVLALVILGGIGWAVKSQLANELPPYTSNLFRGTAKVSLRPRERAKLPRHPSQPVRPYS
jgi:predicted PurR-regulated permease PerM